MTIALSTTVRNAGLDAITTGIGASGFLDIYNGARPVSGGAATTKLAHLALSATAAPASSAGLLTFNAITTSNALATGTASWARYTTSGGTFVVDADVATSASDINLNTVSIVSGGPVAISSATITAPNP